jgi:hypothetical protein
MDCSTPYLVLVAIWALAMLNYYKVNDTIVMAVALSFSVLFLMKFKAWCDSFDRIRYN